MLEKRFIICANDKRNYYLAQDLSKAGYDVALWRMDLAPQGTPAITDTQLGQEKCIMVFSPAESQETIQYALGRLQAGSIVFGGRISPENKAYAERHGIRYVNILDYEPMTLLNAIPTAEGALCLAIKHTPYTLSGANVLVLGYGRVGKATARLFGAVGSTVKVLARSAEARAMAQLNGLHAQEFSRLPLALKEAQIVVNTIPALILGKAELSLLAPDSLVIDLASAPGGVDFAEAEKLGVVAIKALALPGEYAPKSAAEYMQTGIFNLLHRIEGD